MTYIDPPTLSEFRERFPGFDSIADGTVQMNIDASVRLLDDTTWGDLFFDAVSYDAAHSLAIFSQADSAGTGGGISAGGGQLTSSSAAGMSASFGQMSVDSKNKSDYWYSKTAYGQMFLRLRSLLPMGLMADET